MDGPRCINAEEVGALFAGAQACQTGSLRDALPRHLWADPALLRAAPDLLAVSSHGAGYDTVDVAAMTEAGVIVMNQKDGNAEGVAEHAVGMMLALLRRIPEAQAAMRAGMMQLRVAVMGRELAGRTVGMIGLGLIGARIAGICRLAFRCRILATDPYLDAATIAGHGAEKVDLATLLAESDVVSINCPLNDETRGMIGPAALAPMRQGAILVNTARPFIHAARAVLAALAAGRLAGARLECRDREPQPPLDQPLLHHPAVLAGPHIAGVTEESRRRIATSGGRAADRAVREGRAPAPPREPRRLARIRPALLGHVRAGH